MAQKCHKKSTKVPKPHNFKVPKLHNFKLPIHISKVIRNTPNFGGLNTQTFLHYIHEGGVFYNMKLTNYSINQAKEHNPHPGGLSARPIRVDLTQKSLGCGHEQALYKVLEHVQQQYNYNSTKTSILSFHRSRWGQRPSPSDFARCSLAQGLS